MIGYGGYINGVRSENLFGKTYGKTTFETGQDLVYWGNDLNTDVKYQTTTKSAFQNPTVIKLLKIHNSLQHYNFRTTNNKTLSLSPGHSGRSMTPIWNSKKKPPPLISLYNKLNKWPFLENILYSLILLI